jgi:23S rRNA-intervening sequence protein
LAKVYGVKVRCVSADWTFPKQGSVRAHKPDAQSCGFDCHNIAEGKGRSSDRDFSLFLCHARGSLHELETQARIAQQLGYLQDEMAKHLGELTTETAKMLNGFIGSMRSTVQDKGHQRIETN